MTTINKISKDVKYDESTDFLFYSIQKDIPSLADEIIDYVYVYRSLYNDEITGITIENFKYFDIDKLKNTELKLLITHLKQIQKEI